MHAKQLLCPAGHHIRTVAKINETGFIRCGDYKQGRGECGRWVFVFAVRGSRAIIAEVTLEDQRDMDQLTTPAEMLDYLGIFPA